MDDNKRNMVHTKTPIVIPSQSRSNQFFIGYNMTTCCKLISAHLHCVHFLRDHQWQSSARISLWGSLLGCWVAKNGNSGGILIIWIYIYRYILGIFYVVEPTSLWEYQGNTIMEILHILFQVLRVTMFDVCCFVKLWPSNDPLLPLLTLVWKGKHSASPHGGD